MEIIWLTFVIILIMVMGAMVLSILEVAAQADKDMEKFFDEKECDKR